MNFKLGIIGLVLIPFLWFSVSAQTRPQLTFLNQKYETCLGEGSNMVGCSQVYYIQMDSVLNVVYNNLRKTMSSAEKIAFKNEQLKWLSNRDAYFKLVDKNMAAENDLSVNGKDTQIITLDEKVQFVRRRVEELLRRVKN